ncbi:MAG: flagellar hook basal-body protein [Nitrospirota bacterium]
MNKGIYIALSGAVLKHSQMEVISQNLANAATAGYKKDNISFKDYLIPKDTFVFQPDGRVMSNISSLKTDFSAGELVKTGNSLDIAIDGNGFISLEGNLYTRRGDMKRNSEGYLTSYNGIKVLGSSGPVRLPDGKVEISITGDIAVNGIVIDSLKLVEFPNTDGLSKVGDGIFFKQEGGTKSNASVKQTYLEASNVDVIKEMVRMIETLREFESFQKAIRIFDEASEKINNEIGRL